MSLFERFSNSKTPTPPKVSGALPLIGHMVEFRRDHFGLFRRGFREHGDLFLVQLGPWPVVIFAGLEMHKIFFGRTDHELRTDRAYAYLREMLGPVGLTQDPVSYEAERHILQAPFKAHLTAGYVEIMNIEVQQWLSTFGESGSFELVEQAQGLTQQIAAHALMGKAFRDRMGPRFWELYGDLAAGLDPILPPWLPLPKFIRRDRAKKELRQMLRAVVEERRSGRVHHNDMLQQLVEAKLKDGTPLTVDRVVCYVLAFVFAGFETTTGHAAWALIHLLQNPEFLRIVRQELTDVLGDEPDISVPQLKKLKRLYLAAKETERVFPVADRHVRYVDQEMEVSGYRIPKGWTAMTSGSVSHRIETLFSDPLRYDPLRFERGEGKHPLSLIGFGGGKHKCTGMKFAYNEIVVWLAHVLRTFDLTLENPDPKVRDTDGVLVPGPTVVRYVRRK